MRNRNVRSALCILLPATHRRSCLLPVRNRVGYWHRFLFQAIEMVQVTLEHRQQSVRRQSSFFHITNRAIETTALLSIVEFASEAYRHGFLR